MYSLIISPRVRRYLKVIKKENRELVKIALKDIKEDPFIGKPLNRDLKGRYSYRIGVYRIIYVIYEKDRTVELLSAKHRSVVYN